MSIQRAVSILLGIAFAAGVIGFQALPYLAIAGQALGDELPEELSGEAVVLDADTIKVDGVRVRLWGIDAPESDQTCTMPDGAAWPCGEEAATALKARIDQHIVTCEPLSIDPDDRVVARCARDGADIGAWLVGNGWALDWPRYSDGYYQEQQAAAREDRVGIWRGQWLWRRR